MNESVLIIYTMVILELGIWVGWVFGWGDGYAEWNRRYRRGAR